MTHVTTFDSRQRVSEVNEMYPILLVSDAINIALSWDEYNHNFTVRSRHPLLNKFVIEEWNKCGHEGFESTADAKETLRNFLGDHLFENEIEVTLLRQLE